MNNHPLPTPSPSRVDLGHARALAMDFLQLDLNRPGAPELGQMFLALATDSTGRAIVAQKRQQALEAEVARLNAAGGL